MAPATPRWAASARARLAGSARATTATTSSRSGTAAVAFTIAPTERTAVAGSSFPANTGAPALVFAGKELPATAVLSVGAMVKATAAVPLLLLVVAVVARAEPARRARALAAHLGMAGAIALLFAIPFLQTSDPTLGMVELAGHQGWLAPSRFFRRVLDAMSGDTLG